MVQRHAPWFTTRWYNWNGHIGSGLLVGTVAKMKPRLKNKPFGESIPDRKGPPIYYLYIPKKKHTWAIPGECVFPSVDALIKSLTASLK